MSQKQYVIVSEGNRKCGRDGGNPDSLLMETEVMTHGLERLPMREIPYRDRALQEFDLDGALSRKPEIILIALLVDRQLAGLPAMLQTARPRKSPRRQ